MTYQINIYDYQPVADRLPAMIDDYRPKRRKEDPRWQTAKSMLLSRPPVLEDSETFDSVTQAVEDYLALDLKTVYQQMAGQDVKWSELVKVQAKVQGERFKIEKSYSGRVIALLPKGTNALPLLPESIQSLRPRLRKKAANFTMKATKDRYLIVSAGPDGTFYYAIKAEVINKANAEKLSPACQFLLLEVAG